MAKILQFESSPMAERFRELADQIDRDEVTSVVFMLHEKKSDTYNKYWFGGSFRCLSMAGRLVHEINEYISGRNE